MQKATRHLPFPAAIPATGWVKRHSVGCSGKADPNAANLSGQTPMMMLFGGHKANEKYVPYGWSAGSDDPTEILEKLLEAGADVNKTDNRETPSCIMWRHVVVTAWHRKRLNSCWTSSCLT